MGLNRLLLFVFREHYRSGFTHAHADAQPNSYANTDRDSDANRNSDSQPYPNANAGPGHCSRQPRGLCSAGKPQL